MLMLEKRIDKFLPLSIGEDIWPQDEQLYILLFKQKNFSSPYLVLYVSDTVLFLITNTAL